jgi:hypothetical protein
VKPQSFLVPGSAGPVTLKFLFSVADLTDNIQRYCHVYGV